LHVVVLLRDPTTSGGVGRILLRAVEMRSLETDDATPARPTGEAVDAIDETFGEPAGESA
jgi:hypothetical protein